MASRQLLFVNERIFCSPKNGRTIKSEKMDSKLYPFTFNLFKLFIRPPNLKAPNNSITKSSSNHLWVNPFLSSEIFFISLSCSIKVLFGKLG
jgi:hypothetical protein